MNALEQVIKQSIETQKLEDLRRELEGFPFTLEEGAPFYLALIRKHHEATLVFDKQAMEEARSDAAKLARAIEGGYGYLANADSAGYRLMEMTAAPGGDTPMFGQTGDFMVEVGKTRFRVSVEGLVEMSRGYGSGTWPAFEVHAVDWNKPFITTSGFRSFYPAYAYGSSPLYPDLAEYVIEKLGDTIAAQKGTGKKRGLVAIDEEYRNPEPDEGEDDEQESGA